MTLCQNPVQEMKQMRVQSLGQEDPLEMGMATHSGILAWENPMDRGAWEATAHGVAESWTCLCMRACAHTHTHTQLSVKLRTLLNHQCFVCKIIYCVRIAV